MQYFNSKVIACCQLQNLMQKHPRDSARAQFRLPIQAPLWFPHTMKRRFSPRAATLSFTTAALILASCSTPQTRISDHPDLYQSLSPRDQALVNQERIRAGMSRSAVWLAWGSPDRKIIASIHGRATETWIYTNYMTYPYYPYGYPFTDLYDPFYYADVAPAIPYPARIVTFRSGRAIAFQYQLPP